MYQLSASSVADRRNDPREPLRGEVEVDETWVGGTQAGLQGSPPAEREKAALVLVAVEKRGRITWRLRMVVIPDLEAKRCSQMNLELIAAHPAVSSEQPPLEVTIGSVCQGHNGLRSFRSSARSG